MKIFLIILILLWPAMVFSTPSVSGISGSAIHGQNITISGSSFGTKSPATPLLWDDSEGRVVDSDSAVSAIYDEVWPLLVGAAVEEYRTRYRTVPYRSVAGPHVLSTKYLAGGHYQYGDNDPPYIGEGGGTYRAMGVTKAASEFKPRWYASWYYRMDPLETTPCNTYMNHKNSCVQSTDQMYTGDFSYTVWNATSSTCGTNPQLTEYPPGICGDTGDLPLGQNNARLGWIKWEEVIANDAVLGMRNVYIDNFLAHYFQNNCPDWFTINHGGGTEGIKSYSLGGYYRWATNISDITTYRGDNNAFRYFDDIYIDTTFSRVMLCNNATYANATICEPQIPSAWATEEITATVNLGALTGTGYLFVFDSDNVANGTGYQVSLDDATAPVLSNALPSGQLNCAADPDTKTISVTTNENATCKYDTSNVAYDSMANTFSTTGTTSHSQSIGSLACGNSFTYYVRCNDAFGNKNSSSMEISFSIAGLPASGKSVSIGAGSQSITIGGVSQTISW